MKFTPSTNDSHFDALLTRIPDGLILKPDDELLENLMSLPDDTDFDHVDPDLFTALYLAAQYNRIRIVEYLLTVRKVNPDVAVKDGLTAAHIASDRGFTDVLRLLIAHNGTVNRPDAFGETPLFKAISNAPYNRLLETVSILLDKDASTAMTPNEDDVHPIELALFRIHPETIDLLIQHGATVRKRCNIVAGQMMVERAQQHKRGFMIFDKSIPENDRLMRCVTSIGQEYNTKKLGREDSKGYGK